MGGSSKHQTVGYRYYVGMHMVLCKGPIDYVKRITVDDRVAWQGKTAAGPLYINEPELFGGEAREGGVTGDVDIEFGGTAQTQNSYLLAQLGDYVPAFRGVVAAVLRNCYIGLNPYLKKWALQAQRIHVRQDGMAQWYDSKAEIVGDTSYQDAFTDTFDEGLWKYSSIVGTGFDGGLLTTFTIVSDTYGQALSIGAGATNTHPTIAASLPRPAPLKEFKCKFKLQTDGADDCGIVALRSADFDVVMSFGVRRDSAVDAQRRPTVSFIDQAGNPGNPIGPSGGVTLGVWYEFAATYDSDTSEFNCVITNLSTMAVHGSLTLTVTGRSDISIITFENDNFTGAGTSRFDDVVVSTSDVTKDMNPAHIIRECLTDPDWGMGYQDADIDDASFMAAADTLYAEGLGMSLLWDTQTDIEAFIKLVTKHIDAAVYVDRATGKFVLKLIRNDHDINTLIVLNESNIDKISDFTRPSFGELTNSVSVTYWNYRTGEDATLTVQDIALEQMQGVAVSTSIQYPGFSNSTVASRIAQRDLTQLSTPLATCTIYANRDASALNIGDCFKLTWPDYEITDLVMRVTGIAYGDGKANRVRLQCIQDVFSMPSESFIAETPLAWDPPSSLPTAATIRKVFEMPYLELVQTQGQADIDAILSDSPEVGYVGAAAGRSAGAISAIMFDDLGAGYVEVGSFDFSPTAALSADITEMQTAISFTSGVDLDQVTNGTWFEVDDEIMAVTDITGSTITAMRGCLDTVPKKHLAGAKLIFWDNYAQGDATELATSDIAKVKISTVSGAGQLSLNIAPEDTVTIVGRAARPYPPGDVKVNGAYFPLKINSDPLAVTWAHRDRTQQTGGTLIGYTGANIGPEAGATHTLKLYNENDVLSHTESGMTGTSYTWPTATEKTESLIAGEGDGDPNWNDVKLSLHLNGADASTVFADSSQSAVSITRTGDAQIKTDQSKFGGASCRFDGAGDSLNAAASVDFQPIGDFTFEAWVRVNAWNQNIHYIAGTRSFPAAPSPNSWMLVFGETDGTKRLSLTVWDSDGVGAGVSGSTVVSTGAWHHCAFTRQGNLFKIFLNGSLEGAYDFSGLAYTGAGFALKIGDGALGGSDTSRSLNGWMDDIRITKGAARYTANFNPPTSQNPDSLPVNYRQNGKIRYELYSVRAGLSSFQLQEHTSYREGWGFNYGMFYGE